MEGPKDYLTVKQFAKKVGMSTQAIHKILNSKKKRITKFVNIGFMYLIHKSELKDFKRLRESNR